MALPFGLPASYPRSVRHSPAAHAGWRTDTRLAGASEFGENRPLSPLFGFVQFDFAGTLPLGDGRYLATGDPGESVLVVRTLGAPLPRGDAGAARVRPMRARSRRRCR